MEGMAYIFGFMVLAALIARYGNRLVSGRWGLALQIASAAVAFGLAIRAAGLAMEVVAERKELFLVVVAGMLVGAGVLFAIFYRPMARS